MLKKQMNLMEQNNEEREKEIQERSDEIKVKLERTETMFQSKHNLIFPQIPA